MNLSMLKRVGEITTSAGDLRAILFEGRAVRVDIAGEPPWLQRRIWLDDYRQVERLHDLLSAVLQEWDFEDGHV